MSRKKMNFGEFAFELPAIILKCPTWTSQNQKGNRV